MSEKEYFWNVLLVEDDEDDFILIRDLLRAIKGDQFRLQWVAHNGPEVIAMICSGQYDVILMEYLDTPQRGTRILQEVKEKCAGKPMIILTDWERRENKEVALGLGAFAFLRKSQLTERLLKRTIQGVIERARRRSSG